jgi:hypothetical protein
LEPNVNSQKRTGIFEGNMPNLEGKFWIASLAPNPNMIVPLEILRSVDVDQLLEHVKQIFHG